MEKEFQSSGIEPAQEWTRYREMKCKIERDRYNRIIYRPGDGVGVQGVGPMAWLSRTQIEPRTDLLHFLVICEYIEEDDDYVILESIGKGTAVGRLSWYAGKRYTVFRMNDPDYVNLGKLAAERASTFGRRRYDFGLYFRLFTWAAGYWLKELATLHIPPRPVYPWQIPYKSDNDFICIELYFAIWKLVGRRIREHGHAPVPAEVIMAVNRETLVVIDQHEGEPEHWRTPRGSSGLAWATLGKAGEDLSRGDLVALGEDGRVRKAIDPDNIPLEGIELKKGEPVAVLIAKSDFIARQAGQDRNRLHIYRQPYGYPIRACDWVAVDEDEVQGIVDVCYETIGHEVTDKDLANTLEFIANLREQKYCRHCMAAAEGRRTSVGMVNHGHGKGAGID